MKPNAIWKSLPKWALLFVLAACSSSGGEQTTAPPASQGSYQEQSVPPTTINTIDNQNLATIIPAEEIEVQMPDGALFGVLKRSDKRKYYDHNDVLQYTVKYKEDGFKLRNSQEELLWKVKVYPDRIKVANNEEMTNAWKCKISESGKIKILLNEEEQRAIRPVDVGVAQQLGDEYLVAGDVPDPYWGVLFMPDLAPKEQYLLVAELLRF